jgi:VCBS repeat protein/IPT/TIG domain-containing protein
MDRHYRAGISCRCDIGRYYRVLRSAAWMAPICSVLASSLSLAAAVNPVPQINQPLVPESAAPHHGKFTLAVNGTGFVATSVVNWNGAARPTTFVSSTKLTAAIPASDISSKGTASVTVSNPGPGGGVSNVDFFQVTYPDAKGSIKLGSPSDFPAALNNPSWVIAADLNGDGNQDLAIDSINNASEISMLLGHGDGTFGVPTTFAIAGPSFGMTTGDFNGDGKLDLAVATYVQGTVSVLLGNGQGGFQTRIDSPAGAYVLAVCAGDFNGDGKLDLAVANSLADTISVLLGNGDGTFQAPVNYATGAGPGALIAADLNGDDKLDLVIANGGDNKISVLLGNGDGTFQSQVTYGTGLSPASVITADFNGDGKLDLAIANIGLVGEPGNTVSILLGNGDGTFQPAVNYLTNDFPRQLVAGDFNGDDKLDLAAITGPGPTGAISVLLGNGDGTFRPHTDYATPVGANAVATADFNADGLLDFAAVHDSSDLANHNRVFVFLQLPRGRQHAHGPAASVIQ